MYPYGSYDNGNRDGAGNSGNNYGGNSNEYYRPLAPQQRQPDENGYYHFTPGPEGGNEKKRNRAEKKKGSGRKAARYIAMGAAFIVTASAAGGGTAWYMMSQMQTPPASSGGAILHTTTVDKTDNAAGSVASVAQTAADSVVEIDTKIRQENYFMGASFGASLVPGAGSGVIISEDGYVVTNNHVVQGTEQIIVRTTDGTEYTAELIGADAQTDLAVLKVEASGLKPVTFADSDQLQVGDLAVAIGNPLGELGGTVTSGIVSATSRDVTVESGGNMTLLQTNAAINPGNSGGGLFDSNGSLIGIVNAKSSGIDVEGLGFAIPSNTVQKVVTDIIDNGYVAGRAEMGIKVLEVDNSMAAQMLGVNKGGVYITDPGENAGLQEGDRFVFIDGVSIDTTSDISSVLTKHGVGDTLKITVERGGKAVETQVTLQEQLPEKPAAGQAVKEAA